MIVTLFWYLYCSIVLLLKVAFTIIAGLILFLLYLRIRYNITSRSQYPYSDIDFAFEKDKYRDILSYDANSIFIRGKRIFLISGEFHYWRVPDRSRWESILKTYKSCGFNCIRIYFHWGYHSPKQGVYNFDDNRDIDYLLQLCTKLKIFVLAAPGPYICAETQGGGFPLWLIAKREVHLRHMSWLFKRWDSKFADYSKEWVDQIMPILKKHQITEKEDGCLLAVQLENELFQFWSWVLPIGFVDEMKSLAKFTRDLGITVPLFTNDPWEEGGFVSRPENNKEDNFWTRWISPRSFGLDWYGFDKYAIFPPSASPDPIGPYKELPVENWGEWDPNSFASQVDHLEDKVRSFGGEAANTPLLIPELQGGWFSHNCLKTTFDHSYSFFGENFTKTIFDSVVAQGSTMLSLYMVYGGTNWGTLGDPDAYSSYDYGACIREYGHISGRMRQLRLSLLMYRTFEKYFVRTQRDDLPFITASESNIIGSQRCYEAYLDRFGETGYKPNQDVELTLIRNFNENEQPLFDIQLFMNSDLQTLEGRTPLVLQCYLPYKHSFIALGNYTAINKAHLVFSAVPIILRHRFVLDGKNHEVWIIPASDELYTNELAFDGHYDINGNIQVETRHEDEDRVTVLSIGEGEGWISLKKMKTRKDSKDGNLYLITLNQQNLLTLNTTFKDDYHWTNSTSNDPEDYDNVEIVTWGSYDTYLDKSTGQLDVKFMKSSGSNDSKLFLLKTDTAPIADSRFKQSIPFEGLPFVFELQLNYPNDLVPNNLECTLSDWKVRYTQWDEASWTPIAKNGSKFELNAIDFRYTTGHCSYISTFEISEPQPSSPVYLKLDLRHRGTVWVNGHFAGSMTVFSRQIFMPGCHCGPELIPATYTSFDVTRFLKFPTGSGSELNKVVVLTESFGINRQSLMFDDARNPRGLLHATWSNINFTTPPQWYVTGVDPHDLENAYQSSGLFDENSIHSSSDWASSEPLTSMSQINHSTITWYSCKFRHPLSEDSLSSPTELNYPLQVHLKGPFVGYIWINKTLIGRYYGNDIGPQNHFYIMDGILKEDDSNELILAIYPGNLTDLDRHAKPTIDIMNAPIQIEIGPWYVELNEVNQSGNLLPRNEGGIPFIYANTSLQILNY